MLPLLLNTAMDSILKSRYDKYRLEGKFPPEVQELEEADVMPFTDLGQLNVWREQMSTLRVIDQGVGYMLQGKIDDVMLEADGRLIPADYKSSGNAPSEDKQKYYRDQLAAYGFMFHKQGHKVSNRAYLLHYYVRDKTDPSIEVKFDSHVDLVKIDVLQLEEKLQDMVVFLNGPYPGHNPKCEKCAFYTGRGETTSELKLF
jgi:hypothetical protein